MAKRVDSDALDKAELGLKLGLIKRRQFLKSALAAGVSLLVANLMVTGSALAAENQRANRRNLLTHYDYIIVGAGSAGCVLADRLSEDPSVTVLLVEAGGDDVENPNITTPFAWPLNLGSDFDYGAARVSTPQVGLDNRVIPMNGGRILGGSGSINAMIWLRGDERDFDEWENAAGARWGARSMFREYSRLKIHGKNISTDHPLSEPFLAAGEQVLGMPRTQANVAPRIDGPSEIESNIIDGRRFSPLNAYLLPALERRNLTVLTDVQVEKLHLAHQRCYGMQCQRHGHRQSLFAGEVILSAGAIESPALLMRSGIGPRPVLRQANVHVELEVPKLGRELQDHTLLAPISFRAQDILPPVTGTGATTVNYINLRGRNRPPTIQIISAQFPFGGTLPLETTYSVVMGLMKPRSRGWVRITGGGLNDPLMVNPNYLKNERDLDEMVTGFELARELGAAEPLSEFFLEQGEPGPLDIQSREDAIAYIRQNTGTYFHYTGTCKMGRHDDSVVDPSLRLRGVAGLRVVDASVMPTIPSVNTHVPVLLIAEKAARVIARQNSRGLHSAHDEARVRTPGEEVLA